MRKRGFPERGELVVCRITKIHPNSVFADLVEYDKSGMIHVSEVAKRWVRDIREFVRENQYVVCKVLEIEGSHIHLSVKRVEKEQSSSKMGEFKRETKAEKMLELAAKEMGKTLEDAYTDVGHTLQEEFGSLFKAFTIAAKSPDILEKKGVSGRWLEVIVEMAKKAYAEKSREMRAKLNIMCYKPDGINVLKAVLEKAQKNGFDVRYVSAPNCLLVMKGKNSKDLAAKLDKEASAIVKEITQAGGEGSFKIEE